MKLQGGMEMLKIFGIIVAVGFVVWLCLKLLDKYVPINTDSKFDERD